MKLIHQILEQRMPFILAVQIQLLNLRVVDQLFMCCVGLQNI